MGSSIMSDKFEFVFTQLDALQAVADQSRRMDLAHAFGFSNDQARIHGWSTGAMRVMGWHLDPTTEYWVPFWFPEWAK